MRADPGCACSVPEPGQNKHLPLSKENSSGPSKWLGFLVNVRFWSALDLTLNQRVRRSGGLQRTAQTLRRQEKLTYVFVPNSGPTTQTQEDGWSLEIMGPLPVLETLRDKEPFSRHGGIQKERVIVPWAGRRHWVMGVSGSDAPVLDGLPSYLISKSQ